MNNEIKNFDDISKINTQNIVEYWKEYGQTFKDFKCRECGKFMLDITDIRGVKYSKNYKNFNSRLFRHIKESKRKIYQYVESEQNRWLVRGRNLSGKVYFRRICWDCFFKHLPEIENISKRALKSSWYKDIKNGIFRPPATCSSPSKYFKILFDITDEELKMEHDKFDTASLKSFIKRYGEKQGTIKYQDYCNRQAYTCSKEYMVKEKGMTEEEWVLFNHSRAVTKDNLINKHGEEIGLKMWNEYCERQSYAGCKLEYFIEKCGKDKGLTVYKELNNKKRINYDTFIRKYGEVEGVIKWLEFIKKTHKNYSEISQELFKIIDEKYDISHINSHYALKKDGEIILTLPLRGANRMVSLDYVLFNKVIEFYGDYWHGNPKKYKITDRILTKPVEMIWKENEERIKAIEKAGYKVKIVWEGDFYENPSNVIKECIEFLKN